MTEPNVFDFTKPQDFLLAAWTEKRRLNASYSIRAWARHLGFKSPSHLNMILNGKRKVTADVGEQIAERLPLEGEAARYWLLMIMRDSARGPSEKRALEGALEALSPGFETHSLELEAFRSIADWYHVAIRELTLLEDFQNDPKWIASRLRKEVSPTEVRQAIRRLTRLGWVEPMENDVRRKGESFWLNPEVPSAAVRKHHRQMIEIALESLEADPMEARDFSSTHIPIRLENLEKIKALTEDFRRALIQLSENSHDRNAEAVYQINVQTFPLTRTTKGTLDA